MPVEFRRRLGDRAFSKSKAFPRPGETTWIDSMDSDTTPIFFPIDLWNGGDELIPQLPPFSPLGMFQFVPDEGLTLQLVILPAPGLADSQKITFTLLDSDDGLTFAETDPLVQTQIIGADGVGSPGKTVVLALPMPLRQFLLIRQTCDPGNDVSDEGWTFFELTF